MHLSYRFAQILGGGLSSAPRDIHVTLSRTGESRYRLGRRRSDRLAMNPKVGHLLKGEAGGAGISDDGSEQGLTMGSHVRHLTQRHVCPDGVTSGRGHQRASAAPDLRAVVEG